MSKVNTEIGRMFVCAFDIETKEWFAKEYSTVEEGQALLAQAVEKYDFNTDLIEAKDFDECKKFLFAWMIRKGYAPGDQMKVL